MVARNDIVWADVGGRAGRRPVCVLTRDTAIALVNALTCAPVTRRIRGLPSEVGVNAEEGLAESSVINCDGVTTIAKTAIDPHPIGRVGPAKRMRLDQALRYALDIRY